MTTPSDSFNGSAPRAIARGISSSKRGIAGFCLLSATLGASALAASCSSNDSAAPLPYCETTREYFITKVWEPILSRKCVACHTAQGAARESRFVLVPATTPGFIDKNLATLTDVGSYTIRGLSALLLKPTAQIDHGGGMQVQPGGDEYKALSEIVSRTQGAEPEGCAPLPTAQRFAGLTQIPLSSALYKASLRVAGRLPTQAEMDSVNAGGEEAFDKVLGAMMAEPGFLDAVKSMFRDAAGFAPTTPSEQDYPVIESYSGPKLYAVMQGVGDEPLELIAHVIAEGRPLTEILTADYTMVSPVTAPVYGVQSDVKFADPGDSSEFEEVQLSIQKAGGDEPLPHAGVLSTASYLRAFGGGSRERRRADALLRLFAGTDTALLAREDVDITWRSTDFNPALYDDRCTPCHSELDRAAGAFMSFSPSAAYAPPANGWYNDMPPPGFNDVEVSKTDLDRGHQIVAAAVAKDPRFAWAVARIVARSLLGREPLAYPQNPESPSYAAELYAWLAEDTFYKSMIDAFVRDGYRIQTLVREIVKSPYFRASSAAPPQRGSEAMLEGLGTMRLLPPDLLDKKLVALTGVTRWSPQIASEYHYYYALGASGSRYSIAEREENESGLMSAVTERIAHEMACFAVPLDFSRDSKDRLLFPSVSPDDAPTNEGDGAPNSAAIASIKGNIRFLYARLFGEMLPDGHPEIERAYALFEDTFREGTKAIASGEATTALPWACRVENVDPSVPAERRIKDDPRFTVRAWMALIKAMMSDPSFVYEH